MLCQDWNVSTIFDIFVMTEFIVEMFASKWKVEGGGGKKNNPLPHTASNLIKPTER